MKIKICYLLFIGTIVSFTMNTSAASPASGRLDNLRTLEKRFSAISKQTDSTHKMNALITFLDDTLNDQFITQKQKERLFVQAQNLLQSRIALYHPNKSHKNLLEIVMQTAHRQGILPGTQASFWARYKYRIVIAALALGALSIYGLPKIYGRPDGNGNGPGNDGNDGDTTTTQTDNNEDHDDSQKHDDVVDDVQPDDDISEPKPIIDEELADQMAQELYVTLQNELPKKQKNNALEVARLLVKSLRGDYVHVGGKVNPQKKIYVERKVLHKIGSMIKDELLPRIFDDYELRMWKSYKHPSWEERYFNYINAILLKTLGLEQYSIDKDDPRLKAIRDAELSIKEKIESLSGEQLFNQINDRIISRYIAGTISNRKRELIRLFINKQRDDKNQERYRLIRERAAARRKLKRIEDPNIPIDEKVGELGRLMSSTVTNSLYNTLDSFILDKLFSTFISKYKNMLVVLGSLENFNEFDDSFKTLEKTIRIMNLYKEKLGLSNENNQYSIDNISILRAQLEALMKENIVAVRDQAPEILKKLSAQLIHTTEQLNILGRRYDKAYEATMTKKEYDSDDPHESTEYSKMRNSLIATLAELNLFDEYMPDQTTTVYSEYTPPKKPETTSLVLEL